MRRRLFGGRGTVLEKCFGSAARERTELGDQVRLVGEPARERELAPAHAPGKSARALEPQEARYRLRRQPDLLTKACDKTFPAPTEFFCERSDARSPVTGDLLAQALGRCSSDLPPHIPRSNS